MKNLFPLFFLTAFVCVPAHAETVWLGNAFVTQVEAVCGNAASVGDFQTAIYRPAGVPLGNDADSYFALVSQRANFTMQVPNNTFRAGINYGSRYITSQLKFGSNVGGILNWTMSPQVLDTTVKQAKLTFTIANYFGVKGCTTTFQVALVLTR